ncbi:MAG: manganese efflux pump MntP family protein [Burkholderiales bacterium]
MGFIELLLVSAGLSMDAFAVSLCKGLSMNKISLRNSAIISLFFGGFQAVMPLIGWVLGKQFESYITNVDHWIAFGLLAFIGGKMIFGTFKQDESTDACEAALNLKELTLLAVATSIDALAVGVTFAFLQVLIVPSVLIIGIITFSLSFAGVFIGHRFGVKLKAKAEVAGGVVLVLIGLKILLEHLGVL